MACPIGFHCNKDACPRLYITVTIITNINANGWDSILGPHTTVRHVTTIDHYDVLVLGDGG